MNKQYWARRIQNTEPYVPGEQPKDRRYVKLNTNENPYPPSPRVREAMAGVDMATLRLYPDPDCLSLRTALAAAKNLRPEEVFVGNGSDEILAFSYLAFMDEDNPAIFPDITYSFYPVYAAFFGNNTRIVPVREDFSIPLEELCRNDGTVILTNPNAPTGIALPLPEVEKIIASNPDHVVVIDEAYVDFGADSAAALVDRYPNLLVVMTYSKSRSMAGARLGFALGQPELIADLEKLKFSTNPYNVNRLTLKLGIAAVASDDYFRANAQRIMATRETTTNALRQMGFSIPDSQANFLFITHPQVDGAKLYQACKDKGVLIRHFSTPALAPYNRVTIGSEEEMAAFLSVVEEILAEEGV